MQNSGHGVTACMVRWRGSVRGTKKVPDQGEVTHRGGIAHPGRAPSGKEEHRWGFPSLTKDPGAPQTWHLPLLGAPRLVSGCPMHLRSESLRSICATHTPPRPPLLSCLGICGGTGRGLLDAHKTKGWSEAVQCSGQPEEGLLHRPGAPWGFPVDSGLGVPPHTRGRGKATLPHPPPPKAGK